MIKICILIIIILLFLLYFLNKMKTEEFELSGILKMDNKEYPASLSGEIEPIPVVGKKTNINIDGEIDIVGEPGPIPDPNPDPSTGLCIRNQFWYNKDGRPDMAKWNNADYDCVYHRYNDKCSIEGNEYTCGKNDLWVSSDGIEIPKPPNNSNPTPTPDPTPEPEPEPIPYICNKNGKYAACGSFNVGNMCTLSENCPDGIQSSFTYRCAKELDWTLIYDDCKADPVKIPENIIGYYLWAWIRGDPNCQPSRGQEGANIGITFAGSSSDSDNGGWRNVALGGKLGGNWNSYPKTPITNNSINLLSIGGGGGVENRFNKDNLNYYLNSILPIMNELGYNGICFDIEGVDLG